MGTKTITVTEEAYERLRSMKRGDESFTDVLLRVTGASEDRMQGFGAWADSDLRDAVEETRGELDEDFEERQHEMSRQ